MKFFLVLLSFLAVFFIFQYVAVEWFPNLAGVRTIFSLTMAAIFTATGFGIADMLKADEPDESET